MKRALELELAERPNQLYYEIELSRTLLLKGDASAGRTLLRAARLLSTYLDSPSPPMPHAALLLEQLVQLPAARLPVPYTPELVAALCERWFPTSPPLLWLRAGIDFSAGRWSAAAEKLRCLVSMGRTGDYPRYTSFDPAIIGDEAALNLAACEIRIGRPAIAEKLLRPLLRSARVGAQARRNLEVARELKRLR